MNNLAQDIKEEINLIRLDGHKGLIELEVFTEEGLETLATYPKHTIEEIILLCAKLSISIDDIAFSH